MNDVAIASGKTFGIMYNQRTNPVFAKVRDLIASTPAEATRFTLEEKERWGAIIRSTGTIAD